MPASLDQNSGTIACFFTPIRYSFDKAVSHSMMDGTHLESVAKHRADDLHDAAKRDKNNPAVRDHVDRTLAAASEVNRVMLDHRFTEKLQRDWEMVRSDLNALAEVYNLSPLEGAGQGQ